MAAKLTLASAVDVPETTAAREIDNETVLLNLESGIYFGIDELGTRIWRVLAAGGTLADARRDLLSEYDVGADVLESDIIRFVGELAEHGLVLVSERQA